MNQVQASLTSSPTSSTFPINCACISQDINDILNSPSYVVIKNETSPFAKWVLYKCQLDPELKHTQVKVSSSLLIPDLPSVLVASCTPAILDHVYFAAEDLDLIKAGDLEVPHILHQGEHLPRIKCKVQACFPLEQGVYDKEKTKLTFLRPVRSDTVLEQIPEELDMNRFFDNEKRASRQLTVRVLDRPPDIQVDLESTAFVRVDVLAQMGLFSGEIVKLESGRLLTLLPFPEPNLSANDCLYLSPILYHNLGSPETLEMEPTETRPLVAKEVTIARVASPSTTNKTLQSAFLSRLRQHFETCHRVVCKGDLLAVTLDTINASIVESTSTVPLTEPDDIAWFKVTSVSGFTGSGTSFSIVPSQTRMVQSGLVSERVVSSKMGLYSYLGLPLLFPYQFGEKNPKTFAPAIRLANLLSSAIDSQLPMSIFLKSTKRGAGKTMALTAACAYLGIHLFTLNFNSLKNTSDVKFLGILRAKLERVVSVQPSVVFFKHADSVAKDSESDGNEAPIIAQINAVIEEFSTTGLTFVTSAMDSDNLSRPFSSKFKFEIDFPTPTEPERNEIFQFLCKQPMSSSSLLSGMNLVHTGYKLRADVSSESLALGSAGLLPLDLKSIVHSAQRYAFNRLMDLHVTSVDKPLTIDDRIFGGGGLIVITPSDMEKAISAARSKYSDSIGAPRIPNVGWKDVGGLDTVKGEILDTIEMPLKFPELFAGDMKKRSGILFYGPPGTGKTLLAKAIATSFSLNFFSVKGPELLNMYIGESEANVRRIFQKARDARPCVIFFDELDSVAPKRGNQGDSGGVMDRIVSQILAELDGMSSEAGQGVFVVGATNRPDLLDEALLRPGRFDKMLYLGIADTHEKQCTILQALTRKFNLDSGVDLKKIANECPFNFTGADFYAMSSDAMLNAMTRIAGEVDKKIGKYNDEERKAKHLPEITTRWWFQHVATEEDTGVVVTAADFEKALSELVPSVSAEELAHYLRIRQNFEQTVEKRK